MVGMYLVWMAVGVILYASALLLQFENDEKRRINLYLKAIGIMVLFVAMFRWGSLPIQDVV